MKLKSVFLNLSLMLLLIACNGSQECSDGTTKVIKVNLDQEPVEIGKSGLINDLHLVKLETSPECLVGRIKQIELFNDCLYLLTREQGGALFIFDRQGHFLKKVSGFGKSRNEYLDLTCFWIDKEQKSLNLYSRVDKKWLVYSLDGDNLLDVRKMPKRFMKVISNKSVLYGFMGNYIEDKNEPYNYWRMDNKGELLQHYVKIDPSWDSKSYSIESFSIFKGNVSVNEMLNPYIRSIDKSGLTKKYFFDFGKYQWPQDKLSNEAYEQLIEEQHHIPIQICNLDYFQETTYFVFANFIFKGQNRCVIYDKTSDKVHLCRLSFSDTDYFCSFGQIEGVSEQHIITSQSASSIKWYLEGGGENQFDKKYPKQIGRMKNEFPTVKSGDNPFILIYDLKP